MYAHCRRAVVCRSNGGRGSLVMAGQTRLAGAVRQRSAVNCVDAPELVACNTEIEIGSLDLDRQSVAMGRSPSASEAMDGRKRPRRRHSPAMASPRALSWRPISSRSYFHFQCFRPRPAQRVAMYIVISKPKRISLACGVSHFMGLLRLVNLTWREACSTFPSVPSVRLPSALRLAAFLICASRFSLAGKAARQAGLRSAARSGSILSHACRPCI